MIKVISIYFLNIALCVIFFGAFFIISLLLGHFSVNSNSSSEVGIASIIILSHLILNITVIAKPRIYKVHAVLSSLMIIILYSTIIFIYS